MPKGPEWEAIERSTAEHLAAQTPERKAEILVTRIFSTPPQMQEAYAAKIGLTLDDCRSMTAGDLIAKSLAFQRSTS